MDFDQDHDAENDGRGLPRRRGRPSETMSVVAHAGAWFVSVAIIPQLVTAMETSPLIASRRPPGDSPSGTAMSETPCATSV